MRKCLIDFDWLLGDGLPLMKLESQVSGVSLRFMRFW